MHGTKSAALTVWPFCPRVVPGPPGHGGSAFLQMDFTEQLPMCVNNDGLDPAMDYQLGSIVRVARPASD